MGLPSFLSGGRGKTTKPGLIKGLGGVAGLAGMFGNPAAPKPATALAPPPSAPANLLGTVAGTAATNAARRARGVAAAGSTPVYKAASPGLAAGRRMIGGFF